MIGKKSNPDAVVPPTRIERAIFALQVRRLTTWPRRLLLIIGCLSKFVIIIVVLNYKDRRQYRPCCRVD